jgi:hypothetical protein
MGSLVLDTGRWLDFSITKGESGIKLHDVWMEMLGSNDKKL